MRQSSSSYDIRIDIVKVLAILAIILLHTLPKYVLINTFAQLNLWQAVPISLVSSHLFWSRYTKDYSRVFKQ